jgi:hypothetical protein
VRDRSRMNQTSNDPNHSEAPFDASGDGGLIPTRNPDTLAVERARHGSSSSNWITVRQATSRFPLGRTSIYELIREGRIRSLLLRKRGNVSGKRLLNSASIEAYIASYATPSVREIREKRAGNE